MLSLRAVLLAIVLFASDLLPGALHAQTLPVGRFAGASGLVLTLTPDSRYSLARQERLLIGGGFRVDAGQLALRDDVGPGACGQPGSYRASQRGDTLRFIVLADPCEARRSALGTGTWSRLRDALVLSHATVLDMIGAAPKPGMTLVLRAGRIAAIYPDGSQPLPPDGTERDVAGRFVLPGLIDAHVHLATSPSGREYRPRVEAQLKNALLGGVVAVRDMAGDARTLADLARALAAGDLTAPVIRYSAVMAGPGFFDDPRVRASSIGVVPGTAPWGRAITDSTDLRQVVAEARGTGASAIKLYADVSAALAQRLTDEAHRQGLHVWAHLALAPARPSEVVAAGVDVVSHALLIPWEVTPLLDWKARQQVDLTIGPEHPAIQRLFALLRERQVILDPTLFVYRADSAASDTSTARRREARAIDFTRAAHTAGVRIAAGTDGLGADRTPLPNIHEELVLLVRAGFTPLDALIAATRISAEAAGLQETHGTIAVGKAADLLVLNADPLADIRNTRQIALVIKQGRVVER